MKLIGNLLLTIGLITGCLSAATAYLVPAGAESLEGLTLAEGAGAVEPTDEERAELRARYEAGEITAETYIAQLGATEPIVEEETTLTAEDAERMNNARTRYAEVKEFSFARWPYGWVFGLSALGLLAGSLLVRAGAKAEITARSATQSPAEGQAAEPSASPDAAVAAVAAEIEALRRDLPALPSDAQRLDAIISRLGHLQGDQIPTFIEARPLLIARFGLGRYAEIMDRFAAMERKINRAWSAAADNHLPEATNALEDAAALTPEVARAIKS